MTPKPADPGQIADAERPRTFARVIYLDHHAGTPLTPAARGAMDSARELAFANPSSPHSAGRKARELLETARLRLARAVSARQSDLVFTAGGSEACQLGIVGLARGLRRIVTTTVEHPAVARAVESLEARGVEVVRLPVADATPFDPAMVADAITDDTLVAMQWVNHEVGLVFPIPAIALLARAAGARLFVDATQALGKLPIAVDTLGASAVAFASHKIGGPSGAGALYLAPGVELDPVALGGGQERGRRAGSPALEAIVGFGGAASALDARLGAMGRVEALRDRLERGAIGAAHVNARSHPRVATCSSLGFVDRRGSVLVAALDLEGVCVASGPACSSGLDQPSPTVTALSAGDLARANGTLRFSLGPESTSADVDSALAALERVLARTLAARTSTP